MNSFFDDASPGPVAYEAKFTTGISLVVDGGSLAQ